MIASSFVLALLSMSPVAVASPIERIWGRPLRERQAGGGLQAIQDSIKTIGTQLAAANNTLVGFQAGGLDGITGLISVNDAVVKLGDSITATINVATQTPRLNAQDSSTVGISFLFLQPNLNLLLNNLVAKRPQFDNAAFGLLDVRSLIHDSLTAQQNTSTALGTALINILDPSLQGIAQPINDQIQGNFTGVLNQFNGRAGVVKIPTALVPTVSNLLASIGPALTGLLGGVGGAGNSTPQPGTAVSGAQYCCGITQAQIDKLGPDENDLTNVPGPIVGVLRMLGVINNA